MTLDPPDAHAELWTAIERLGRTGLTAAAAAMAAERATTGVTTATWADGRQIVRPFPLGPVPRVIDGPVWDQIAAGVQQRHRALNAFLADAYRAGGRRRGDADRAPEIVRAGVLPEWAVAHSPGHDPAAVAQAWPGQPRATVAGVDVVQTQGGAWVGTADHLRTPAGLGYALSGRETLRRAAPELFVGVEPVDPRDAVALLQAALVAAAPPACAGEPRIAVLTAGESDNAWFEHPLLAGALGVPLARAADVWPRSDGGVEIVVDGDRRPVDVFYRRFDDRLLGAVRTPIGRPLGAVLSDAVRAGRLALANVPGNELADDVATCSWVPAMIDFYLAEKPLLGSVPTWVLADPAQWSQVRERLHELVVTPVAGYGGRGVVVGPACSAAELASLQAEVSAAPYRFIAQEPLDTATVPALVDGDLGPSEVGLRVLSVAGPGGRTTALPAPLTRVGTGAARGSWQCDAMDTWILR